MELLILIRFIKWIHGTISAWEIKLVVPYLIKCLWMKQLASAVTAAGEEHREIACQIDREYLMLVNIAYHNHTTLFDIKLH